MDNLQDHHRTDDTLKRYPQAHLLQMETWGRLKSGFGWYFKVLTREDARAVVLFRRLPLGLSLAYVPMGPLGNWLPGLLQDLDALCRKERAIALKVEPDLEDHPEPADALRRNGFLPGLQTIQPPRTILIDLDASEEEMLARMNQKTRYNIRLAARKGVSVAPTDDLDMFTQMMGETGERNEFGVHSPDYYRKAYELFHPGGYCELMAASYEDQPLAALMVFKAGTRAWYLYGASTSLHRNLMPTYLLQWETMLWAKQHGCTTYDLWGIPDEEPDVLEQQFQERSEGLWGVYRFKRGFGGRSYRTIGAWDRPFHPVYKLYNLLARIRKAS